MQAVIRASARRRLWSISHWALASLAWGDGSIGDVKLESSVTSSTTVKGFRSRQDYRGDPVRIAWNTHLQASRSASFGMLTSVS